MKISRLGKPSKLIPHVDVSTRWIELSALDAYKRARRARASLSWCDPLGVLDYVVDRPGKIIDAGARNNDRVPAPVRFLGDPQEFTPVVLAELDVEMLPFDLQLPGLNEIIHACKKPRS